MKTNVIKELRLEANEYVTNSLAKVSTHPSLSALYSLRTFCPQPNLPNLCSEPQIRRAVRREDDWILWPQSWCSSLASFIRSLNPAANGFVRHWVMVSERQKMGGLAPDSCCQDMPRAVWLERHVRFRRPATIRPTK